MTCEKYRLFTRFLNADIELINYSSLRMARLLPQQEDTQEMRSGYGTA